MNKQDWSNFWEGLLQRPGIKQVPHHSLPAPHYYYFRAPVLKTKLASLGNVYFVFVMQEGDSGWVELYIKRPDAAENRHILGALQQHQADIEANFGDSLVWDQYGRDCRIWYSLDSDLFHGWADEPTRWTPIYDALIAAMIRLVKAILPHLQTVRLER